MDAIKSYLENMFLHLPKTAEVLRAKEELAQMMGSLGEANRTAARETLSAARKRASQLNQSTG